MKDIDPMGRDMLKKKVLNATVPGGAVELTHPTDKLSAGLKKADEKFKEFEEKYRQTKCKAFDKWIATSLEAGTHEDAPKELFFKIGFYAGYDACNIFKMEEEV